MSTPKNKKNPAPAVPAKPAPIVAPISSGASEDVRPIKEEVLRWIFSIAGALIAYLCVAYIIQAVYHPDINISLSEAKRLLISPEGSRPEPMEATLFRYGVVIILLGMLGLYRLFSNASFIKDLARKQSFIIITGICIAFIVAMTWFDFTALNPFYAPDGRGAENARDLIAKTNFDFYFAGFFLGKYLLVYTFLLVPLIACIFFLGIKKYGWENNKLFNKITSGTGYTILVAVVLACVGMSVFYFPYAFETKYNLNAVYYSMTQVHAGTPMLVGDFTNTYGLYPHFLNLIFHFTGLSVFKFTLVMALLIGLAFTANFYALRQFVSNNVILFLGMLTVIFFPFLDFKYGQNFDCNFAFYPIRYIIPSTLIFLATRYFKKPSQLTYWLTFVLQGFFVLWNPEIGLVCFMAWIAVNIYNDTYTTEGKINFKKMLLHPVAGAVALTVVIYVYKSLVYAFYGAMPDISQMFSTIVVFGKVGSGLLPMSLVHPWNLMAVIVILGFIYAISMWWKKEITPKMSLIFMLSVLSVGFFVYFQGRSHDWQLAQSSCMCLILLTILGSDLWEVVKKNNILPLSALFVVFLFFISFSLFEIVGNTDRISELVNQDNDKTKQQEEQTNIESNADFIVKNTQEKQKIYVFTARQYQDLYFDGNKRVSAFNPGWGDLFLKTDLDRLDRQVRDSSFSVFIEPAQAGYPFFMHTYAALAAGYDVKAVNKTMYLLNKRKTKVPAKTYFANADGLIIDKKYTDDSAGINARTKDALGTQPLALGTVFSVEVLFYSNTQMFPYATLAGNMDDSSGFIIANIINTPNYFFGVNGKGMAVAAPNNTWVYCVMNVFPDHLEVYENGAPSGAFALAAPMRQSPQSLAIGNLGYMRYYMGPISEVAIHNKPMDKAQVAANWEEIKKVQQ